MKDLSKKFVINGAYNYILKSKYETIIELKIQILKKYAITFEYIIEKVIVDNTTRRFYEDACKRKIKLFGSYNYLRREK